MPFKETVIKCCPYLLTLKLLQTCMRFFLLLSMKMLVTKQLMVANNFYNTNIYQWKSMADVNYCVHIFFCAQQKDLMQVWNILRASVTNPGHELCSTHPSHGLSHHTVSHRSLKDYISHHPLHQHSCLH